VMKDTLVNIGTLEGIRESSHVWFFKYAKIWYIAARCLKQGLA
jgi:hypothetical protein